MRIGIDYRPALHGRGGIAVYARELVAALAAGAPGDRLELYGHRLRRRRRAHVAVPAGARLHRRRVPAPALALAARAGLGADRVLGAVDVMHWTDFVALRTIRAPVVATVHDLLFEELPECYTPGMRRRLGEVAKRFLAAAAAFIVPSARVRDALLARHGVEPERVFLVPHGRAHLPEATPAHEHGRYVLCVGTLEPRKNHRRLLAAFRRVRERVPDLRLVVAGARGWMDGDLVRALARADGVVYEGAVGDRRLSALYAGAHAVAYPSLGEGFGLPVLEALARARPALVGADTACSDLAADAALAADPRDEDALADALERLCTDAALRERLAARGPDATARFTWGRAARATREVYAKVAAP